MRYASQVRTCRARKKTASVTGADIGFSESPRDGPLGVALDAFGGG
jgi:hypothetical protein